MGREESSTHGSGRPNASPHGVVRLALAGLAVAAASVLLPWTGPVHFGSATLGVYGELTTASFVAGTLLGGLALLAATVVARIRQPANPIWRLLAATYSQIPVGAVLHSELCGVDSC